MKPYNPFNCLPQSKLSSEIRVRSTHSNKVSINEYILHKSIGKGSYAQVRAGYDLIEEQPVALRFINRKNLARKLGLYKTDQMIANSSLIHLMLKKSIQLFTLIYMPKVFQQLDDQLEVPVSHQLYNNFDGDFTLQGKINIMDNFSDQPSLRSTTPRYSNEYCYDNCIIQVLELANAGTLKDLDASEMQLRFLLNQVAQCLQEIHENQIIHCDLKAENIMILEHSKKLQAKLTDFDTSIILNKNHQRKLSQIRYQDIFSFHDMLNFNFVIIDAYSASYVGEIITTPAISAPETRSFANVFKGQQTDIWQLGQLFLSQFCANHKNISLQRASAEYQIIEQQYDPELADLISGLTEYNSAYRYSMNFVFKHKFFNKDSKLTIQQFHLLAINQKARAVIIDDAQLLQSSDMVEYQHSYRLLRFWIGFYMVLNRDVRTVFQTSNEQFTLRQTQCQRVENFVHAANQALRRIIRQITKGNKQCDAFCRKMVSYSLDGTYFSNFMTKMEMYTVGDLYSFLTPEICGLFNRNSLLQRCIVEIIDIRDLKHLTKRDIYRASKILHYFNLLIRLAAFNIGCNYYEEIPIPIQQFQSTFEMDVLRRKQQLGRATAVPSKHIEVVQSFANLEAFLGKESTASNKSSITPAQNFDDDDDSDEDLPCKYVPPVTSIRNQASISLPRLHLTSGAPQAHDAPLPKATFEHREVILENVALPEVSNLGSDSLSDNGDLLDKRNNTAIRNDDPQILRKLQLNSSESQLRNYHPREARAQTQSKEQILNRIRGAIKNQHIDFQNISSESSSSQIQEVQRKGFGKAEKLPFEPLNWQLVRQSYQNSPRTDGFSSETEEMLVTIGPDQLADVVQEITSKDPALSGDSSAPSKIQSLFQVTKVSSVESCVINKQEFDIGECSDSESDF